MIRITLAGRTDIDEYFKLSGVFESERLTHTPLLVFIGVPSAGRRAFEKKVL
jgi:hypothetical protein